MDFDTHQDQEPDDWLCTERKITIPIFVVALVVVAIASALWEMMTR